MVERVEGLRVSDPGRRHTRLFVHFSAIEGSGYRELTEGQRVQFESQQGQKGPQAKSVRPA